MSDAQALIAFIVSIFSLCGAVWGWILWLGPWIKESRAKRRLKVERLEFELRWYKQHSPLPMYRLDAELNVIWSNKSLNDLLDVDSNEILGRVWFKLIHQDELKAVTDKWKRAVRDQSPYRNVQRMFVHGKHRKYLVTGDPFIYCGKIREYIGTVVLLED